MATATIEYYRWTEATWKNPQIDWTKADPITCGIDIGSVSSQAVIMTDGEIFAYSSCRTGANSLDSARKALDRALEGTGLSEEKINFIVGTGYGRFNCPMANRQMTEIACHARGANYMGGVSVRTILDMGGQDCKAIHCDEKGKVTNFLMNDKCAAGTGRGMEVMAEVLRVPLVEIGQMSLDVDEEPPPVSSTCVVFAKSEALARLRKGWDKNMVLASYCGAMAKRVVSLLKRVGVEEDFVITGGIAKNIGIVTRIERELDIKAKPIRPDPQIAGALGAALFARDLFLRQRGS
ncbi:MAG: benzoyl-CoA reductase, bzd-type, subunit Q [Chloroflexi bacterium]|nr:benzoyl-CoA reductase, bzd-type, subunit Q [Chloroflexota bacterium]